MTAEATTERPTAERLGRFVAETSIEDLPPEVRETAVRAITDGIGVTLAGLATDSTEITGSFTDTLPREGLPLGGETDAALAERALHLGTAAHALDYDDLSWAMDGHPTVVLLPPILALADAVEPNGEEVLTAYAVGFETASYVAYPISPGHYEAGWHATSTFGAIAATATAASLLDLDAETAATALNVAASTPSGLKENFGTMTKPLHAGLAARSGVTSALLARDGFTAGETAIEGSKGFWSVYSGTSDFDGETSPVMPGEEWVLAKSGIHLKKYPACYFTHSSIAATRSLLEAEDVDPTTVERVEVEASAGAGDALVYTDPETALQSKFSMPHAVAVAMTADRVSLDWFEPEAVGDETLAARRSLVDFSVDDDLEYDSHTARVTIATLEGTYREERSHPPWTHQEPPTAAELEAKFVETSTQTVSESSAREAFERLQALESVGFLEALESVTD
ncbi:MAG: MmgE/PrpD family protein [Halanaeroarchaeum sp.]